mmetsp:Transcript_21873/g.45529  ORF Transcript_21873/g.45529 Transcript_21873/m.45529 type:complete len:233 (+) Transcript_21873:735-1433(+)
MRGRIGGVVQDRHSGGAAGTSLGRCGGRRRRHVLGILHATTAKPANHVGFHPRRHRRLDRRRTRLRHVLGFSSHPSEHLRGGKKRRDRGHILLLPRRRRPPRLSTCPPSRSLPSSHSRIDLLATRRGIALRRRRRRQGILLRCLHRLCGLRRLIFFLGGSVRCVRATAIAAVGLHRRPGKISGVRPHRPPRMGHAHGSLPGWEAPRHLRIGRSGQSVGLREGVGERGSGPFV